MFVVAVSLLSRPKTNNKETGVCVFTHTTKNKDNTKTAVCLTSYVPVVIVARTTRGTDTNDMTRKKPYALQVQNTRAWAHETKGRSIEQQTRGRSKSNQGMKGRRKGVLSDKRGCCLWGTRKDKKTARSLIHKLYQTLPKHTTAPLTPATAGAGPVHSERPLTPAPLAPPPEACAGTGARLPRVNPAAGPWLPSLRHAQATSVRLRQPQEARVLGRLKSTSLSWGLAADLPLLLLPLLLPAAAPWLWLWLPPALSAGTHTDRGALAAAAATGGLWAVLGDHLAEAEAGLRLEASCCCSCCGRALSFNT